MTEWRQQLDRAEACLSNPAEAFMKAFGALEICFGAVARRAETNGLLKGENGFAHILRTLADHKLLNREEYQQANHIAAARNVVAHAYGFEPSSNEVERTIKTVERLCAKFGKSAHEVMVKPVVSAKPSEHVARFVPFMVNDGFSQIPVVSANRVIGTLTDVAVLKAWEKGEGILEMETCVEQLMTGKVLPHVKPDLSIEEVRKFMIKEKAPAILILHAGLPQGIITRFDLLEHVGATL